MSTEAYIYAVKDQKYGKLFSYNWHPAKFRKEPHFHIKQGASIRGMNRRQFPSGRMAIESLIRFLIEEMDVPYLRSNWDSILSENQRQFEAHRRWHS